MRGACIRFDDSRFKVAIFSQVVREYPECNLLASRAESVQFGKFYSRSYRCLEAILFGLCRQILNCQSNADKQELLMSGLMLAAIDKASVWTRLDRLRQPLELHLLQAVSSPKQFCFPSFVASVHQLAPIFGPHSTLHAFFQRSTHAPFAPSWPSRGRKNVLLWFLY